jgi:uncharacterized protein (TIGR02145 family)
MFRIYFLFAGIFLFISCYKGGGLSSGSSIAALSSSSCHANSSSSASYRTVQIGEQLWMAENFNYNVPGSKCYNNDTANCDKYGMLYDWATAMALPNCGYGTSCGSQITHPHRGICPQGWHIPSNDDWDRLVRFVDGTSGTGSPYDSPTAGRCLKAQSGWNGCGPSGSGSSYVCEGTNGFSALPDGYGHSSSDDYFSNAGSGGYWWSASENYSSYAYSRSMYYSSEYVYWYNSTKYYLFSVRCVKD